MNIDHRFKEYSQKVENITPEEAIDILIQIYIDACGISLSERTVARCAANFWLWRLNEEHPELPENLNFRDIMELRSEEYRQYKKDIDKYTCGGVGPHEILSITTEMLDDYDDETTRVALCAGIFWFLSYMADQAMSRKEQYI